VLVREYGVVEADGAAGHHSARIVLRAPRIAVRVESGRHWQSMFALAMWAAASRWGGYGFIYIPRGNGSLHPALARVLRAYDPDYLVDALWTHGDIEALGPGWHARHVRGWPADPGESARMLSHLADQVVREAPPKLCAEHTGRLGYWRDRYWGDGSTAIQPRGPAGS
jgi:hypothetical protein